MNQQMKKNYFITNEEQERKIGIIRDEPKKIIYFENLLTSEKKIIIELT